MLEIPLIIVDLAEQSDNFVALGVVVSGVGHDFAQVVHQARTVATLLDEGIAELDLVLPVAVQLGGVRSEAAGQSVQRRWRAVGDVEVTVERIQRLPQRVPERVAVGLGQAEEVGLKVGHFLERGKKV